MFFIHIGYSAACRNGGMSYAFENRQRKCPGEWSEGNVQVGNFVQFVFDKDQLMNCMKIPKGTLEVSVVVNME